MPLPSFVGTLLWRHRILFCSLTNVTDTSRAISCSNQICSAAWCCEHTQHSTGKIHVSLFIEEEQLRGFGVTFVNGTELLANEAPLGAISETEAYM